MNATQVIGDAGEKPAVIGRRRAMVLFMVAFLTWMLTNMDQSLFGYAVPDLIREFDISIDHVGMLISLCYVAGIASAMAGGILTDLFGPRWTLPICLGVSAALVGAQGLVTGVAAFSILRVAAYGFSAALSPICNAVVANAVSDKHRPLLMATLQCAYPMGWFVASFLVAPLISGFGWRMPFLVVFGVVPIAMLFWWLLPKGNPARASVQTIESVTPDEPRMHPVRELWMEHRSKALLGALAFFLYGGAAAGTVFYLPTFFREVRGYDAETATYIVGLSYGISMIGYFGSGLVSQTLFSRRTTTIIWMLAAAVGLLMMIWLPTSVGQDIAMFSGAAIFFFGTSAILTVYLVEIFPKHIRATATGICASGGISAGSALFPMLVAHFTHSLGWQMSLTIVIVPLLVLSAIVTWAMPKDR